jgi:hypothetical protein
MAGSPSKVNRRALFFVAAAQGIFGMGQNIADRAVLAAIDTLKNDTFCTASVSALLPSMIHGAGSCE